MRRMNGRRCSEYKDAVVLPSHAYIAIGWARSGRWQGGIGGKETSGGKEEEREKIAGMSGEGKGRG